jgi:hypothetical protein
MARYLYAQLNQGRSPQGGAILSPQGIAALHTPGVQINENVSYGMGWTFFPSPQAAADPGASVPTALSHAGDWSNFRALMTLIPEQELGVLVFINKKDPTQDSAYNNIGWNMALLALALAGILLLVFLPEIKTTLPLALSFELGAGLIYLLILVFTLGWGTLRTALAAWKYLGMWKASAPADQSSW